jgi:hypothetical protein
VRAPRVIATASLSGRTWPCTRGAAVRSSQAQVHVTNFDYNHHPLNTMPDTRLTSRARAAAQARASSAPRPAEHRTIRRGSRPGHPPDGTTVNEPACTPVLPTVADDWPAWRQEPETGRPVRVREGSGSRPGLAASPSSDTRHDSMSERCHSGSELCPLGNDSPGLRDRLRCNRAQWRRR